MEVAGRHAKHLHKAYSYDCLSSRMEKGDFRWKWNTNVRFEKNGAKSQEEKTPLRRWIQAHLYPAHLIFTLTHKSQEGGSQEDYCPPPCIRACVISNDLPLKEVDILQNPWVPLFYTTLGLLYKSDVWIDVGRLKKLTEFIFLKAEKLPCHSWDGPLKNRTCSSLNVRSDEIMLTVPLNLDFTETFFNSPEEK